MRMFQGYGISEPILKNLVNDGVTKVLIIYHGVKGEKFLLSKIDQWVSSDKNYRNKEDDNQKFLSESEMVYYKTIEEVP